jgi:hypothetical protein
MKSFTQEFGVLKSLAIIGLCILAAIIYGILHDQITARICVEYFTIGHPPVFHTESPTLLGLGWGIIATWWVGLILGVPLAIAARLGSRPEAAAASLVKPVAVLLLIMAGCALLAGVTGFVLARHGLIFLTGALRSAIPPEKQVPFIADLWSHLASYIVGFLGGIVLIVLTWRRRQKLRS